MSMRDVISNAGKALKAHRCGQQEIEVLWNTVEWKEHSSQEINSEAELARDGSSVIRLYPNLVTNPNHVFVVLREFGELILLKAGAASQEVWKDKLMVPTVEAVKGFSTKIGKQRGEFNSYMEIIESFDSPVDRLTAINLANALIANNISYASSEGLNIYQWGQTCEYANRKRYHSITPLVSAYGHYKLCNEFGEAFAELVLHDLKAVRHTAVAKALENLISSICLKASSDQP